MFNYGTKFAGLGYGTFPNFAAKNASGPTATDGFPYTADSVNDWIGFTQDLLNRADLTPNGNAEAAGSSQLINALMMGAAQRPGDIVYTAIPQEKMGQNRLLILAGQVISITGPYSRLAANVYVGDTLNPTAAAFYKCDASGNRSTGGNYMKLPDCRGLFLRAAGQNGTYTRADGTPYDGGAIGEHKPDAMQNHRIAIYNYNSSGYNTTGAFSIAGTKGFTGEVYGTLDSYLAGTPRTANETRGAGISVYVCMAY